ncbi:hypothetical protein ACFL1O_00720 [Patescibacteria group bacterium]
MGLELFKKIKINRLLSWQISVIVFLILFGLVLSFNVFSFKKTYEDLNTENKEASSLLIDTDLLDEVVIRMEEKNSVFLKLLLEKSIIKDPSL